jgi:hypothetical protein
MAYSLFGGMFGNNSTTQLTDEELYSKIDYLQTKVENHELTIQTLETSFQVLLEKFNKVVDFLNIKDTYEYLFDGLSMMTNTQLKARTTKTELNTLSTIPNNKEKFCKAFLLTKLRRFIEDCNRGERVDSVDDFTNYIMTHNDIIESVKQYFKNNQALVKVDIQNFMINHRDFFNNV